MMTLKWFVNTYLLACANAYHAMASQNHRGRWIVDSAEYTIMENKDSSKEQTSNKALKMEKNIHIDKRSGNMRPDYVSSRIKTQPHITTWYEMCSQN